MTLTGRAHEKLERGWILCSADLDLQVVDFWKKHLTWNTESFAMKNLRLTNPLIMPADSAQENESLDLKKWDYELLKNGKKPSPWILNGLKIWPAPESMIAKP